MELWVKGPDGQVVAVFRNGKLTMHTPLGTDLARLLGFELFTLLVQLMNVGGGAAYGGPLAGPGAGDSDFGSPSNP